MPANGSYANILSSYSILMFLYACLQMDELRFTSTLVSFDSDYIHISNEHV